MKSGSGGDTTATRPYTMRARAAAAERTAERIAIAAFDLWRDVGLDEMTLQQVAERAGVTVQTVLRRFGSKDGVIQAGFEYGANAVVVQRATAPHDDLRGAALAGPFPPAPSVPGSPALHGCAANCQSFLPRPPPRPFFRFVYLFDTRRTGRYVFPHAHGPG